MNCVQLIGRLVKDPEARQSQSGSSICRFTIAVNRMFRKDGQPDADFINCTAFGKTADNLAAYQRKGMMIGVTGKIQTSSYDNQQGQRIFRTDVIADAVDFLTPRQQAQGQYQQGYQQSQQQSQYHQPQQTQQYVGYNEMSLEIEDGDLPF